MRDFESMFKPCPICGENPFVRPMVFEGACCYSITHYCLRNWIDDFIPMQCAFTNIPDIPTTLEIWNEECARAEFTVEERIVLKNKKTGEVWY